MKRLIVITLASLMILSLSGCETTSETGLSKRSRMVTVEHGGTYRIVYDRETSVMYVVATQSDVFTVLVDADGKPLLYEGGE